MKLYSKEKKPDISHLRINNELSLEANTGLLSDGYHKSLVLDITEQLGMILKDLGTKSTKDYNEESKLTLAHEISESAKC